MNRLTLGGLALLLFLAAGCGSGGLSTDGPLGNSGQNSTTICAWTTPGGVVYDGLEEFNDTGGTATIDKVALVHPRHLRLVAAWVADANGPVAGIGRVYPHPTKVWLRIPGAVVHPNHGQQVLDLVVVVKPTAKLGTATAINLYYEVSGTRYLRPFADGLQVQVGHICH